MLSLLHLKGGSCTRMNTQLDEFPRPTHPLATHQFRVNESHKLMFAAFVAHRTKIDLHPYNPLLTFKFKVDYSQGHGLFLGLQKLSPQCKSSPTGQLGMVFVGFGLDVSVGVLVGVDVGVSVDTEV